MISIDLPFRLLEPSPAYLPEAAAASFTRTSYKELVLCGVDIRLETDGSVYELSISNPPHPDGLRSRGLAFAREVVPLATGSPQDGVVRPVTGHTRSGEFDMSLEQQILLPNGGNAVAISWRLLGKQVKPVRLSATPIFSSAEATSSEIFNFEGDSDGGRLTWLPFRRAARIIADTNGHCAESAVTIPTDGEENKTAPSVFVFDLGRRPSLLFLSAEGPANGVPDPILAAFLARLASPAAKEREFLTAA